MPKAWRDMPQAEQAAMAQRIDAMCAQVVADIAVMTATGGRPAVLATLENLSIGAECKAILTVPKEQAGQLIASTKQIVAVMQPGAAAFMGEASPAQIMQDEPALPLGSPHAGLSPEVIAHIDALCGGPGERCAPESHATLLLQQTALTDGRRHVQMFPTGTPELPLPNGMDRVVTDRGVFHFNPDEMDAVSIVAASNAGEENLLLGLGPYCKAEVVKAAAEGQPVICVVERASDGTEVLAALTVKPWAEEVKAIMVNQAGDGHSVDYESVETVLNGRAKPEAKSITIVAPEGFRPHVVASEGDVEVRTTAKRGGRRKKAKPVRRQSRKPRQNGHDPEPTQSASQPTKRTGSPFQ